MNQARGGEDKDMVEAHRETTTSPRRPLDISLDRRDRRSLAEQIFTCLRAAILSGLLETGTRLPSWRDLAVQLGVARGTVRAAYDRLADEMLVVSAGAAGTRVAALAEPSDAAGEAEIRPPLAGLIHAFSAPPLPFQMGVPAQDAFPAKLWSRLLVRAAREAAAGWTSYADPRGQPDLRARIAGYLAIARGLACVPDQVIVTSGYRNGLGIALQALRACGRTAWVEEPGYPLTRSGLGLAGVTPIPVPVDSGGIDVEKGIALAADARLAVVTPGQQAPTGVRLSPARRRVLLDWAAKADAWIIEDDYLSELQLQGRAAPALAAAGPDARVVHLGTFSKTLSPTLGVGFLVAPRPLAAHFAEVAATLSPAPSIAVQTALCRLLAEGHYLRHLRHMKRLYAARLAALRARLDGMGTEVTMSGLALLLSLPSDADDVAIAARALGLGLAPTPLSPWYAEQARRRAGLLLSVTNLRDARIIGIASAALETLLG